MVIRLQLMIFLLSCFCFADAQKRSCYIDSRLPEIKANGSYDYFLEKISSHLSNHAVNERSEKWLQVVVHVVAEDTHAISYAQVVQQIDVLNTDFAKKGNNILKLNEEFVDLAAD